MSKNNTSRRIHNTDLFVNSDDRPGWVTANEREPSVGEEVYCAGGAGELAAVLGKTGDGSRLLEIRLAADPKAKPFFAAGSNVLVAPPVRKNGKKKELPRRGQDSSRSPRGAETLA
jgi:hypothetical protein